MCTEIAALTLMILLLMLWALDICGCPQPRQMQRPGPASNQAIPAAEQGKSRTEAYGCGQASPHGSAVPTGFPLST